MTKTTTRLSPTDVEERFEDAARTLRRLPDKRVPGYKSGWPEVVRSAADAYGWEPATTPRLSPSPQAISQMEEVFGWLAWIEGEDTKRIVWLRAEGVRWKPICWRIGISRTTAWQRWAAAMITIANQHNAGLVQPRRKQERKKVTATIDGNSPQDAA
jgi:hypothetical protein